ncbi:putative non-specific serine/threonine protein kinase [Helianthus anomalus]
MAQWWSFRWQIVVVAIVLMVFLPNPGRSEPQTHLLLQTCSRVNATNTKIFFSNLNETFRDVRRKLSNSTYFTTSNLTTNSEPVYVMAQCRNYMSTSDCLGCFDYAASSIRACATFNGARSVLDGCFL